jgi:2,3-bisphosphoglycerate-independent phosphoglycerate mutase
MDRDNRWDRVEKAYNAIVCGEGERSQTSAAAIAASYAAGKTDEFMLPTVISADGLSDGRVRDGDGFIFFNFRSDRAREITRAIALEDCPGFQRKERPRLAGYVCMTEYDATFALPIAYGPEVLDNILGGVLSAAGKRQLRIAETEKYAHVTFFFNGGVEEPFPGEDRCLIPSPKEVATYDQKPEMSAYLVTDELLRQIDRDEFDVIVLNFANADMVGHTGILSAAVRAIEAVDSCVGRLADKILGLGGLLLITADHGNAEIMVDESGGPHTAHTTDRVPFILVDDSRRGATLRSNGILADIAPTIVYLLGIPQPKEMTGSNLLVV